MFDILAHPDLVKMWGSSRPMPARRSAALLRACARGDRRIRDRRGGLDGGTAQARGRDLPRAGVHRGRGGRRVRRSRSRATPTCRSRSASPIPSARPPGRARRAVSSRFFERAPAPFGAELDDDHAQRSRGYDFHRLLAGRPLVLGGVYRGERPREGWPVQSRRPRARRDRRAARRGGAGRHRHAFSRQRRAVPRRRFDRAARRGGRPRARCRLRASSTSTPR